MKVSSRLGRFLKVAAVFVFALLLLISGVSLWWTRQDAPRMARLRRCIDREVPAWRERLRTGDVELGEPDIYLAPYGEGEFAIFHYLHDGKPVAHRALKVRSDGAEDGLDMPVCEAKESLVEEP